MSAVIGLSIVACLILALIVLHIVHKRSFWTLAAKHPDTAYDHFRANVCWRVFEEGLPSTYRNIVPKPHWAGPYKLIIPKIGHKTIHVFGKYPDFSRSQSEFISKLK
jgi:hypothetical protein